MRTLVLNASPHANGNTTALTKLFLKHIPGEHSTVSAYAANVSPCAACGACARTGLCIIEDAMPRIWEKLSAADLVVIASPLHFTSLTAPMVALISRWQSHWHTRRLGLPGLLSPIPRRGVVIATGGADYPNMFDCARRVAAAGFVTLDIEICGMLSVPGLDAAVAEFSPETRREAEELARAVLARRAGIL